MQVFCFGERQYKFSISMSNVIIWALIKILS